MISDLFKLCDVTSCYNTQSRVTLISNFYLTYPFISDDLVSFLLQLVETQPTDGRWVLCGFGLLIGRRGTPGRTCGGDVLKVEILVAGQVFLLQGLKQHVWMVPNLSNRKSAM